MRSSPPGGSDPVWRGAMRARDKVAARLRERVGDDGRVSGLCLSRVLESVLTLLLLRATGLHSDRQQEITGYLQRRREAGLSGVEVLLADAAAGVPLPAIPEGAVGGAGHGSARKQLMFTTILAALGAIPFDPAVDLTKLHYDGHATWTGVVQCAVKVLNAYGSRRPWAVTVQDRNFLIHQIAHGSRREVWEGHLPAHLLALLAIHQFQPRHPLLATGTAAILRHQREDGGFPFILDMTTCLTAVTGIGLARAGTEPGLLHRMADHLAGLQAHDGGWPYTHGVTQTDSDSTSWTLQFLHQVDAPCYRQCTTRALAYYQHLANPDGAFPTYLHGDTSEIAMTAGAVIALAGSRHADTGLVNRATAFLLTSQQPDGTFERSWSLSESFAVYRVLDALHHTRHPDTDLHTASRTYLTRAQNTDGGWGHQPHNPSDPISTSHALLALHRLGDTTAITTRGLNYLIDQQTPDGTYHSIPDQAAPRPLPYDMPILANTFPLLALATLTQTDRPAAATPTHHTS